MIRKVNVFDLLTVLLLGIVLAGNQKISWVWVFFPYLIEGLIFLLAVIDRYYDPFHRIKAWLVYWQAKMQHRLDKVRNERYLHSRARAAQKARAKAVGPNDPVTYKKN